jgi:DNA-binding GntR family transcriptional regulator
VSRRPATKAEMIVGELRALIANGEIARGQRLQQDELALRFQTSITPVREAIKRLEAEGVLVTDPHRRVRVSSADVDQIKGIYVTRRLLEPYAAQRAALRVSRQDLRHAQMLIDRMADPGQDLNTLNREFHFHLYEKCGIPALVDLLDSLWRSYPWDILSVLDARRERVVAEHREIADAVARADHAMIAQAIAINLRLSYLALVEHLTGTRGEDPFELEID